jgi:L-aminopeptidase/D-esterase-like protein
VASGEVRGGAPATREFELLVPGRLVQHVDAVVLTGGSAFGLASAEGVVRWCVEHERGFATPAMAVPIVVAMGLYDLAEGQPVAPSAEDGYRAARAASEGPVPLGLVGAGTGARIDKWHGPEGARPGGLVGATERDGDLVVSALMAVNAWGTVGPDDRPWPPPPEPAASEAYTNTTIGIVVTNGRLDKLGCFALAQGASDGVARATTPAHALADGDAVVAAATGAVDAEPSHARHLAMRAVERAILTLR